MWPGNVQLLSLQSYTFSVFLNSKKVCLRSIYHRHCLTPQSVVHLKNISKKEWSRRSPDMKCVPRTKARNGSTRLQASMTRSTIRFTPTVPGITHMLVPSIVPVISCIKTAWYESDIHCTSSGGVRRLNPWRRREQCQTSESPDARGVSWCSLLRPGLPCFRSYLSCSHLVLHVFQPKRLLLRQSQSGSQELRGIPADWSSSALFSLCLSL